MPDIVIETSHTQEYLECLDGRTYQVHALPGGKLRLYPVTIDPDAARCPVVLGGERCGLAVGHNGKHTWSNGD